MIMKKTAVVLALCYLAAIGTSLVAQQPSGDGPQFVNGNELLRPTDYRSWPCVGSSLGLSYMQGTSSQSAPPFTSVFVNPSSYRAFLQTGQWPDRTILVLEVRRSATAASPLTAGQYPTDLAGLEAHVKDSRLPGGWAFFNWGPVRSMKDSVGPIPVDAAIPGEGTCVDCHVKHGAVERTFVQFYPQLMEVAKAKGTVKAGF
jgi:hypothetical protein